MIPFAIALKIAGSFIDLAAHGIVQVEWFKLWEESQTGRYLMEVKGFTSESDEVKCWAEAPFDSAEVRALKAYYKPN